MKKKKPKLTLQGLAQVVNTLRQDFEEYKAQGNELIIKGFDTENK